MPGSRSVERGRDRHDEVDSGGATRRRPVKLQPDEPMEDPLAIGGYAWTFVGHPLCADWTGECSCIYATMPAKRGIDPPLSIVFSTGLSKVQNRDGSKCVRRWSERSCATPGRCSSANKVAAPASRGGTSVRRLVTDLMRSSMPPLGRSKGQGGNQPRPMQVWNRSPISPHRSA